MAPDALIELDVAPPPPARRRPAHRNRHAGLLLVVALVFGLAGAAPPADLRWRPTGSLPERAGDVSIEVGDGRVYVTRQSSGETVLEAYAPRPLRLLWRTPVPQPGVQVAPAGGSVLVYTVVDNRVATAVYDAATGTRRWSAPVQVLPLSERTALVQDADFRPGTEYDQASGDPGPLYFDASGVPYRLPPERTTLRAVDLVTGAPRWSTTVPGAVYVAPSVAGAAVVAARRLMLLDPDTGVVRVERAQPPAGGQPAWAEVVGELLLLRRGGVESGEVPAPGTVTAYALHTLRPRWQLATSDEANPAGFCSGLPCTVSATGALSVRDPVTGVERWRSDGRLDLHARRGAVLLAEGDAGQSRPVRTVDPVSGAAGVDLGAWRRFADGPAEDPLVLLRDHVDGGTLFGVLLPGARAVRHLGRSAAPVTACRARGTVVACHGPSGVQVFTFRTPAAAAG